MKLRGRVWLGLWLLLFLGVAVAVVARQRGALAAAARLRSLQNERLALEARRAEFETRIREAGSRPVLVPRARERLKLRDPSDSESFLLTLPAGADTTR
jgi:hypothetical protein